MPGPNEEPSETELFDAELAPTRRLGTMVADKLGEAILSGRLKEGDALPSEGRLAESFGVSKQIVREAIRSLAAIGVVSAQQGKVARVCELTPEPLRQFFRFVVRGNVEGLTEAVELRRILEPQAAALAAARHQVEDAQRLGEILSRMEQAIGDVPAWSAADLEFHETVWRMSENRLLSFQLRALAPVIREIMAMFNSPNGRSRSDIEATFQRHVAIHDGVVARDSAAAASAMFQHFSAADERIRTLFPGADTRALNALFKAES